MKRADIEHLATLARLRLSEQEMVNLESELSSIMSYVSVVSDIAGEDSDTTPQVGVVHNVLREDVVKNEPNQFTDDIMGQMPQREGRFLVVKKILHTDS